jgi:hypothetical protein
MPLTPRRSAELLPQGGCVSGRARFPDSTRLAICGCGQVVHRTGRRHGAGLATVPSVGSAGRITECSRGTAAVYKKPENVCIRSRAVGISPWAASLALLCCWTYPRTPRPSRVSATCSPLSVGKPGVADFRKRLPARVLNKNRSPLCSRRWDTPHECSSRA